MTFGVPQTPIGNWVLGFGQEAEWGCPWLVRQKMCSVFRGVSGMSGQRFPEHLKIVGKLELESWRETGTQLF